MHLSLVIRCRKYTGLRENDLAAYGQVPLKQLVRFERLDAIPAAESLSCAPLQFLSRITKV
jgi:hypothetical protein